MPAAVFSGRGVTATLATIDQNPAPRHNCVRVAHPRRERCRSPIRGAGLPAHCYRAGPWPRERPPHACESRSTTRYRLPCYRPKRPRSQVVHRARGAGSAARQSRHGPAQPRERRNLDIITTPPTRRPMPQHALPHHIAGSVSANAWWPMQAASIHKSLPPVVRCHHLPVKPPAALTIPSGGRWWLRAG